MPTGQPWQKGEREVSPAEHRYLMTVIATASNPRFTVSRVDIDRPGPTYTIDTLRDLRASCGAGGRAVLHHRRRRAGQILCWKDADELFELAHFVGRHPARLTRSRTPACPRTASACSRCRLWPSPRPTAAQRVGR